VSEIDSLEPLYFVAEHDIDNEVFLPIIRHAKSMRCMSGYFTSGAISELARSLSYFLRTKSNILQFIISPNLSVQDLHAIESALNVDENIIPLLFPDFDLSEKTLRAKAIEALSYLIATKKLEIKLALQSDGLFHTKCWIFETDQGSLAVHGSVNATRSGISKNFEQLAVSRSWTSEESDYVVTKIIDRFERIWDGDYNGIKTVPLNSVTTSYLLGIAKEIDKSEDVEEKIVKALVKNIGDDESNDKPIPTLQIPSWINYLSGDFAHQGKAVKAWEANDGKGVLSIATGGGKTLTSLIAASLVAAREEKLLVVVAVPTITLLNQWSEDVSAFNIEPVNSHSLNSTKLAKEFNTRIRKLKFGHSKVEVIITTHDTLKSEKFVSLIDKAASKFPLMLIGDEVHNLGSAGFQNSAPAGFNYFIGLSATHERMFDEEGTNFLLDYFGPVVYEFTLEDAIGVCLVPFEYHIHRIKLTEDEEEEWLEITAKIKKLSYASSLKDGNREKDIWTQLCIKRRRILESAENKVIALASILPKKRDAVRRSLIFCTDKYPEQLSAVNKLLTKRSINFHQVTGKETSNKKALSSIIKAFDRDELQVLTSKRVLDEGFNIPQTETAYLLASNTNKRQWVQRIGRVLRKHSGKEKAVIHDFLVLPNSMNSNMDSDLKGMLKGEYKRVQFFSELSINGLERGGSIEILNQLLQLTAANDEYRL